MSDMDEMMCRQCGSLLESRDLVCPCCRTPRFVSTKVQYKPSRPESVKRERLFDVGPDKSIKINLDKFVLSDIFGNRQQNSTYQTMYRHDKEYTKTESRGALNVLGFILGCCFPIVFSIIIAIVLSEKTLRTNKNMTMQQKSVIRGFRKSMIRGAICVQVIIPIIIGFAGMLFEYL